MWDTEAGRPNTCGRMRSRWTSPPPFSRGQALCRPGISGQEEEDPPPGIPGAGGRPDSRATTGGVHPAGLPQGRQGLSALPLGGGAPHPLRSVVLQPQRPRHGGLALRGRIGTAVRWAESSRSPTRRDHNPELPTSPGAARTGERDPEMRQTKKGNQWHSV